MAFFGRYHTVFVAPFFCGTILAGCANAGSVQTQPAVLTPSAALRSGAGDHAAIGTAPGAHPAAVRRPATAPSCTGSGTLSFVGGGLDNIADGTDSGVLGGYDNDACAEYASVVGGDANAISADSQAGSIVGGTSNVITSMADDAYIGGGYGNTLTASHSGFIGGGYYNSLNSSDRGVIAGGTNNTVSSSQSVIAGGYYNTVGSSAEYGFIGGGTNNMASGEASVVGGGGYNTASGVASTVGGGGYNTASGNYATIPGGTYNSASGSYSFAAGKYASAATNGSFVWSDGSDGSTALVAAQAYQFLARASGGFTLYTNAGSTVGAQLGAGSGTWASLSDRNAKTNIAPLDDAVVLAKVAALPISRWSYRTERGVRHVGPMAQDFYAAFGVGEDNRHITSIDEDGVALAAIKALEAKNALQSAAMQHQSKQIATVRGENEKQSAQIASVRRENEKQSAQIAALQKQLKTLTTALAEPRAH